MLNPSEIIGNLYQNKWESRSSIRTRPRKLINFEQSGYFFPVARQPLFTLQEISEASEEIKSTILLWSLVKYLFDIVRVEINSVCLSCHKILENNAGIIFNEIDKLNAYTVIIDEYYHVYTAQDLINQLQAKYLELRSFDNVFSDSQNAILVIKNKLDIKYHDAFDIIAGCLFETTLVQDLIQYFNSPDIHPSIKYYINDHINDESRHQGYFSEILCYTWGSLDKEYRQNIGKHLPEFIKLYLNIDSEKNFNKYLLEKIGFSTSETNNMIRKLYQGFVVSSDLPVMKQMLSVVQKAGILVDKNIKAFFNEEGFFV